jgi:hypothetical protein
MTEDEEPREYASSPCLAHEFEELPISSMSNDALAARLNELLEGERAGARGLLDLAAPKSEPLGATLDAVARDEARFCSLLARQIERLGGTPSRAVGAFYDKLMARETLEDKLRLLDRGQSAVVRVLDELLPQIHDAQMRAELEEMRDVHVRNIARCAQFLTPA